MTISIWWAIPIFYTGLFGGIFITLSCQRFKQRWSTKYGHF